MPVPSSRLRDLLRRLPRDRQLAAEAVRRLVGWVSTVPTDPFLDPDDFDWARRIEQHADDIRHEALQVLQVRAALPRFQDLAPDLIQLSDDDRWRTYWFAGYGIWDHANCIRTPRTAAVLRSIPGMTTAFFSILEPGKHLPPHHGPYRGVLRYHLALVVPEPRDRTGIEVGGQVRHWEEGRSLVFDDTYLHRAWNDTDQPRVVLFCDVERPLRWPASWINRFVIYTVRFTPFARRARAQHVEREAAFARAWGAVADADTAETRPDAHLAG